MKDKPKPLSHMVRWHYFSSIISIMGSFFLALTLVTLTEFFYGRFSFVEISAVFFVATIVGIVTSFVFGTIIGWILGLINGALLWVFTRQVTFPYTATDMKYQQRYIYPSMFIATFLVTIFILTNSYNEMNIVFSIISVIAAIIATYAAHRYLLRLHTWSKQFDVRKRKAKNDDLARNRLSDGNHSDAMLKDNTEKRNMIESH